MANELVVIEQATALDLFTAPEKVNQMLERIKSLAEEEQKELDSDLSVVKNRKAFASLAYKVTQTKTAIDKAGKLVVDDLKELPKKVDAARKVFRDELDKLSAGIRKPLTDLELLERAELDHSEALQMNELFDLRKAEEERQRIAHEEELKKQAAEQARLEAERKAQQEIEASARREREAKEAAERAGREKQEAIQRAEQAAKEAREKAEREKQLAIETERKRAQEAEQARLAEEERKRQEEAKRQADKEHRRKYNQETLQALVSHGFDEKLATEFIKLVASNKIPHMTMNY